MSINKMFDVRLASSTRQIILFFVGVALIFLCVLAAVAAEISPEMLTAAKEGKIDDVKVLLAQGQDVNATSAEGVTALMVAASENRLSVVRALLDAGADARMKTASGKTAAFFAAGKGNTEVAATLEQAASKPPLAARLSLLVSADFDCTWKLDGESQGRLAAGDSSKVQVELGKHIIDAVTVDGADRYRQVVELTKIQQELVTIGLKSVHDSRLRAEEEARAEPLRRAEQARRGEAQRAREAQLAEVRRAQEQEALLPTWKDPSTGLMWARKDNGSPINQKNALNYCRALSLAGFRDWRLPEIDELAGILDFSARGPIFYGGEFAFDVHVKGGIQMTECCGLSATRGSKSGQAWHFDFRYSGDTRRSAGVGDNLNYAGRALCVRRAGE